MTPAQIRIGDVIMVTIDGNVVPCVVLTVDLGHQFRSGAIRLEDTGSGRAFWRSVSSLLHCKRFNNTITTYRGYSDFLKHNAPDVTVKFLQPAGTRKPRKVEITINEPQSDIDWIIETAKKRLSGAELADFVMKLQLKGTKDV